MRILDAQPQFSDFLGRYCSCPLTNLPRPHIFFFHYASVQTLLTTLLCPSCGRRAAVAEIIFTVTDVLIHSG